jgi:CheY-like chemotaxis protein
VDDDVDSTDLLATLLQHFGQDTLTVSDPTAAEASALKFAPHIALIDLEMPRMSGFEIAMAFKSNPELQDVGLIAVSGWSDQQTMQRSREFGFSRFFAKPAPLDQICFALCDYG